MRRKFLLDENVPRSVLKLLRSAGFDAKSVLDYARGFSNSKIAIRSIRVGRIIVTMDVDFLKFECSAQRNLRILLVRVYPATADRVRQVVDKHLGACLDLLTRRNVVVLTDTSVE